MYFRPLINVIADILDSYKYAQMAQINSVFSQLSERNFNSNEFNYRNYQNV